MRRGVTNPTLCYCVCSNWIELGLPCEKDSSHSLPLSGQKKIMKSLSRRLNSVIQDYRIKLKDRGDGEKSSSSNVVNQQRGHEEETTTHQPRSEFLVYPFLPTPLMAFRINYIVTKLFYSFLFPSFLIMVSCFDPLNGEPCNGSRSRYYFPKQPLPKSRCKFESNLSIDEFWVCPSSSIYSCQDHLRQTFFLRTSQNVKRIFQMF